MSFLIAGAAAISAGIGVANAIGAGKAKRKAERQEKKNRREMNRLKAEYGELDTSNPFLNMENQFAGLENTMEDLTVNQQQAQFEAQQFQQSQANILGDLRGAAGGSGIAALAQQMAQSGQLAAQRSSATIGQQEAANQMAAAREASRLQQLEAGEASRIQGMERQGEVMSRNWERDRLGTMLGMSQQETAAARQRAAIAEQAKWDAFGDIGGAVMSGATAFAGANLGGTTQPAGSGGGLSGLESQSQLDFLSSYGYTGR